MQFIELTGKTLLDVVNEGEIDFKQLHDAGVNGDSIVRINKFCLLYTSDAADE